MDMFNDSVLLMALSLILAIGIERLLELLRAIEEYREARYGTVGRWQRRAEVVRDRLTARLEVAKGADPSVFQRLLGRVARYLSPVPTGPGATLVISSDQIRTLTIKLVCRIYGMGLGLVFAYSFDLNLFVLVAKSLQQEQTLPLKSLYQGFGIALSGIAMGLGAEPVHKIITTLERGRKVK